MLEQLFGSKTRIRLLRVFFREPERSFFVRELARAIDVQINAVRRELETLAAIDLIKESDATAKDPNKSGASLRKYYQINTASIIHSELLALLLKEQLMGEQEFIEEIKRKAGTIKLLLLSGSFTQDGTASTDLLLVGTIKERALARLIAKYEKAFGFEIRYTTMSENEFQERRYVMDKFIFSLFETRHIKAVNQLDV